MKERAVQPGEVQEAEQRFLTGLAHLRQDAEKDRAGQTEDVSDIAPHLLSMRRR